MNNPLLPAAGALLAGIVISKAIPISYAQSLAILILLLGLTSWTCVQFPKRAACRALGLLTVSAIGLLTGIFGTRIMPKIDADPRETVLLSGCVVSPPIFYEGRDQFTLELGRDARARVSLMIREGDRLPDLVYGQRVEVEGRIRPIRNFQNPGAFDYEAYTARQNTFWTVSVPAGNPVRIKDGRCGSRLTGFLFALRTSALQRIEKLYAGNAYATGLMEATLIGESTKLQRIWTDHFRRTGTYHMLVIDGLHITVLAAFLLFLLRLCFVPQMYALLVTAAGAWIYALVSGFNAPAVRAAGGFTLYLVARYFYRRGRVLNLLAAAAMLYLLYDPNQLFDSGFQLSFLAVAVIGSLALPILEFSSQSYVQALAGIVESSRDPRLAPCAAQFRVELRLLADTLRCFLPIPRNWLLSGLAVACRLIFFAYELAVISAAIQIGLAVPMAAYFHRISLTGVSANILVVPLLALVVPLGFIAIFTGLEFPAHLAGWLLNAGEWVADWHIRFEPDWRMPGPPLWLALCFLAALLFLAWTLRRPSIWIGGATGAVFVLFGLIFWHPFPPATPARQLELTAIDVGQGDSLLICFPDSKLMLVDGGGILSFGHATKPRLDIGEDVVSPYLWSRSIRQIDVVVLTHAHDDHARGLPAVIENFHPAELWTGVTPTSEVWSEVQGQAHAQQVKIVPMEAGRSFPFGGTRIEILSPPSDYIPDDTPKNNDSLVMRITYGRRSFLLTGDMEKPMEVRLLADGQDLHADVLKVGHHGSNTSSTEPFLEAVAPAFAVISDGFANPFHHPHPAVLKRLAEHRAAILRTDVDGLISIRTDGEQISYETFRSAPPSNRFSVSAFFDF